MEQKRHPALGSKKTKKKDLLPEHFVKTNFDIVILGIFFAVYNDWGQLVEATGENLISGNYNLTNNSTDISDYGSTANNNIAPYAILFPW